MQAIHKTALSLALAFAAGALLAPSSGASALEQIAFQGRALSAEGAPIPNGAYRMSFTLFDAAEDGDAQWSETNFSVPVAGGLFTVMLGSIEAFPEGLFATGADLWLEIAIDIANNGLDAGDIQSPRTPLTAVPVAFHARNADTLEGQPASDFALSEDVYTQAEIDAELAAQAAVIDTKADADDVADALAAQAAEIDTKADTADVEAAFGTKLDRVGAAYIMVEHGDTPLENGANLLAAVAQAAGMEPNGAARSAENRATVIVPPGVYELGETPLVLAAEFVDLVGLSTNPENQRISGEAAGLGTGVLMQTANDVRIENLSVHCTEESFLGPLGPARPAAYFPESNLPLTRIRNCVFFGVPGPSFGMRMAIEYSGTYIDVVSGAYAFGGYNGGIASGVFIRCKGEGFAFGGASVDSPSEDSGIASGVFIDCEGGSLSFGANGEASGRFVNCTATGSGFGSGADGVANGEFIRCSGGGSSFGGGGGTASGYFEGCRARSDSFGGAGGVASGVFVDCVAGDSLISGTNSFGGGGGVASGEFRNCRAVTSGGAPAATSFGGGGGGIASGLFINCEAGQRSFGGGTDGSSLGGRFYNCRMAGTAYDSVFRGRMEHCTWGRGMTLGDEARVYNSTFGTDSPVGGLNLGNSTAGVAHNRVRGSITNAGNASFNAFNLEDSDVR